MQPLDGSNLNQEWFFGDQLGIGGFAKVYLAQSKDGEPAVVKLIPKTPGAQRELLFENLDGVPNVVPIVDRGEWDDYWVLVMPKADMSLRDYLVEKGGQLTIDDEVSVLIDVVEALVAIEGRVVHRDIKPENILRLDDRWCLADFGIARYAEATTAPDTMKYSMSRPYAAPEQWRGEKATSATDVYAFGVVAYELLTGRCPFNGPDYRRQHLEDSVDALSGIPARLQSLVEECLYKAVQARPIPQNLLTRLQVNVGTISPGASQLQSANALAVQRIAEEQRQQSVAKTAAELQEALREVAGKSLERVLALLDRQVMDNAPSVRPSGASLPRTWLLNDATLRMYDVTNSPRGGTPDIPFEVIAHTTIRVTVPENQRGYAGRSHSLWYCDAQEQGAFRWYEIAFCQTWSSEKDGFQPFASPPDDEDIVFALNPGVHTVQVARRFTPIDQGEEESFVERWLGWFAAAAQGQLHSPRQLPEEGAQGSWRRNR